MNLILITGSLFVVSQGLEAQFLREYVFVAPTPNSMASNPTASFGILPAPPPSPVVYSNGSMKTYAAGVGLEERVNKLFGLGLDLAGLLPGGGRVISNSVGAISPMGYLHWPNSKWQGASVDLYGSGGYTLLFQDFTANGFNVGGGLNYWFKETKGLMLEFRWLRVIGSAPPTPAANYYEIRFGMISRR